MPADGLRRGGTAAISTLLGIAVGVVTNLATSGPTWPTFAGLGALTLAWVVLEARRAARREAGGTRYRQALAVGDTIAEIYPFKLDKTDDRANGGSLESVPTTSKEIVPRIFINYRKDDSAFAAILLDEKLAAYFGRDKVFRDSRSIPLGAEFDSEIWSSLATSDVMLVVIGPRWLTLDRDGIRRIDEPSDYVRREIATAIKRRIRIIPILIGDTALPAASDLPEDVKELVSRQYMRMYPRNAHRDVEALLSELSSLMAAAIDLDRGNIAADGLPPEIWNVPNRSLLFVGRDDLLSRLRLTLCSDQRAIVWALHGMGGVGKTQLAIEYAHVHSQEYEAVWWINAEQPELIGEQIAALAVAAGLIKVDTDTPASAKAALSYLRRSAKWLVIFDNARTADDLVSWIPQGNGHILITSRSPMWAGVANTLAVGVFPRHVSVEYLRDTVDISLNMAEELSIELGDLPLALAQAVSVMLETPMSASDYLIALKDATNIALDAGKPIRYPASLAAAIRVALDRVAHEDEQAGQLARVCALLAPDPIPVWLFKKRTPGAPATAPAQAILNDLSAVARYGLVQYGSDAVHMHRLTQAIISQGLGQLELELSVSYATTYVVDAGPEDARDPRSWPQWARLLPHVLALERAEAGSEEMRALVCRALLYLRRRGELQLSRQIASDRLPKWRAQLGCDDPDTLRLASNLCASLWLLGEYEHTLSLGNDNLARLRRVLGDEHPDTLRGLSGIATTLMALGLETQGRALHEQACAIHRKVFEERCRADGEDHPDTLRSKANLANSLWYLGHYELALALDEDVLERRRHVLGEDHPDTLFSANGVAILLRELGEYRRARQLDEEVLARRRRVLGEDHPDTLQSTSDLAESLRELGDYEGARVLIEDVLARRSRVFGEDHPLTLQAVRDFSAINVR